MAFKFVVRSGRSGKSDGVEKKRKVPKNYEGCGGDSNSLHVFSLYGKPKECCIKCGVEHEDVTRWRKEMMAKGENTELLSHPFVVAGYWSGAEYKRFMKK